MASIFTFDPDPPRVSSPWSTSGTPTPLEQNAGAASHQDRHAEVLGDTEHLAAYGLSKLEPEPQEGPVEYKLHLLLRPRRSFITMSTSSVNIPYQSKKSDIGDAALSKSPPTPSMHSRQQRLQQLTTQLLWRLQQSSPFHSSSTANLVLPVLPEATPKLGLPQKPTRLLPGLEESQGALYEIGVADDGTFVGLTEDELDESLNNLRAMSASLGCKVDILRKVIVGSCEWADETNSTQVHSEKLWVAEALVSPDLEYYSSESKIHKSIEMLNLDESLASTKTDEVAESGSSSTPQIRISITGPSTAGKSTLLGTLTTSSLDNGRGKSRLSLLKHRHEISSGITSSIAHELIGYRPASDESSAVDVINYASGNIAAWNDIHAAADGERLAFVSDLPGLTRYVKSTLRGLISWAPHYVLLCIPANSCSEATEKDDQTPEIGISLAYLDLCIRLELPILLAITKLDLASRSGLKNTLSRVLSAIKGAGKKPIMLPVAGETSNAPNLQHILSADDHEILKMIEVTNDDWLRNIPILLTSAVNGSGIGKLHALLWRLPIPRSPPFRVQSRSDEVSRDIPTALFSVNEVFAIPPSKVYSSREDARQDSKGVVLCGIVRQGSITVGDECVVGPIAVEAKPDDESKSQATSRTDHSPNTESRHRISRSRPSSGDYSSSFGRSLGKTRPPVHAHWQRVRVVSVRNLRLSVRSLLEDQVGTIGVEPIPSSPSEEFPSMERLRKGMVLARMNHTPETSGLNGGSSGLAFGTGFVASFPVKEFSSLQSPPLILGGNAVVYIAGIRSSVKVTCVALSDQNLDSMSSHEDQDVFNFEEDEERVHQEHPHRVRSEHDRVVNVSSASGSDRINITFAFISSIEWIAVGSRVVVMPGTTTSSSANADLVSLSGLEGFVGEVVEVKRKLRENGQVLERSSDA
ncbi:hypothetical protein VTN31DRAFT_2624 [Thermomyces dupontii]|uniref:uncharacterized protein n=1 Tax=Talaromyces thermophilus TaxID=28565 RepID=UPI0037429128